MKRKTRKNKNNLTIAADRAAHVLHILIADGKLAAKDVTNALKRREELIHELRARLAGLVGGKDGPFPVKKSKRKVTRKKRRMSPARRAALRLNGRYMGLVRRLSTAQKAALKAIRGKKGVRAGIAAARKMARSFARAT